MKKSDIKSNEFMSDLIYQGIKFLIYDYYTTTRGKLRKAYLLSNIKEAFRLFYTMVGYRETHTQRLTKESVKIIEKEKDFKSATAQILANNMINSIIAA